MQKKILSLKNIDFLKNEPTPADFGICIHKILELYSKSTYKGVNFFLSIAKNKLNPLTHNKKNLWYQKITRIAEEFVLLDNQRNANTIKILAEEYGQMSLKINNKKNLIIFGIFDKIEIFPNAIYIIDYKTGQVPSTKSVMEGKNMQLTIGLLIAKYGKFNNLPYLNKDQKNKIAYIKLNNSPPYWETFEIALSPDFCINNIKLYKLR